VKAKNFLQDKLNEEQQEELKVASTAMEIDECNND
jgi:hypothetical protein